MTSSRDLDRELTLLRQRTDTIEEVLKGIRNEVTLEIWPESGGGRVVSYTWGIKK